MLQEQGGMNSWNIQVSQHLQNHANQKYQRHTCIIKWVKLKDVAARIQKKTTAAVQNIPNFALTEKHAMALIAEIRK
jgi:hypothetical protein